ncbi:MYND-type domain-containing protein [Mycena venus]|uniref:MYND-type domain-containing protein n=1 Tax=Mycena venus TaxID=2733690 RepID=A0A8H7CH40_9AGAR|nr:MYND-type domain-containing protein [Mycena venus]
MLTDADREEAKDNIWKNNQTVWHAWEPECDACGLPESELKSPKDQLLSCSGCLVAKYCSKECQKKDWSKGHKTQCHIYEANRKLSSIFAKSLGPGTINDPKLSLAEKHCQWNFLNIHNHLVIAAVALKNDKKFAGTANVALLLSMSKDRAGSKYEHRTFFIDRVLLLDRDASDSAARVAGWTKGSMKNPQKEAERTDRHHFKLMAGWCSLPGDQVSSTQMWQHPCSDVVDHVLPPGFDLNRYVTHVNRGITHFHASFWPLPRNISDADIESAKVPAGWREHALRHHQLLSGLKGGQSIVGYVHADGTREPFFKGSDGGHFRRCAPGETDSDGPAEYKKLLTDPSKMVRLLSKHLEIFEHEQNVKMTKNITRFDPRLTMEEVKKIVFPGHSEE